MRKRILTAVLAMVMLMSIVVFPTNAATSKEETALRQKITKTYKRLRASNNYKSYNGYCGKMAALTLYYLGVDKKVNVNNGKDEYDAYKNLDITTGGYKVRTYPASKYTIEEALYAISEGGTRDVYNILMGFQKTDTTAGKKYGHAMVIYGIINGNVYFTESFYTMGSKEGQPVVCTIQEFAEEYDEWTVFEGAVYFGTKSYADFCTYYPADLYMETLEQSPIYNMPSSTNVDDYTAEVLMEVRSQERVEVAGLYKNTKGELFYEVHYNGMTGFMAIDDLELIRINAYKITSSEFKLPDTLKKGKGYSIDGAVKLAQDGLNGLKLAIIDESGNVLYSYTVDKTGSMASITKAASNAMKFSKLDNGVYTYSVTCDVLNYYVSDGAIVSHTTTHQLVNKKFAVGDAEVPNEETTDTPNETVVNGWQLDESDGLWKYYVDGELASGWIFDTEADYYILENGTAATGCVEINGENRYFTASGVMCTGWYDTEEGRLYLLSNGAAAKGWHRVQGVPYYFDENGILDPNAEYAPEGDVSTGIATDEMFAAVFENLSVFTDHYENFFK